MARHIEQPLQLVSDAILRDASESETVLCATNMAGLVGVMQQIGYLATYSHEIFSGLAEEADKGVRRISALKERLVNVSERLGRVGDAIAGENEAELAYMCSTDPGMEFTAEQYEESDLFLVASRPSSVRAAFDAARPPPQLALLDQFVEVKPSVYAKYGFVDSCACKYSDANFFMKVWLDEEEEKQRKLKQERKARREARRKENQEMQGRVSSVPQRKAKRVQKKRYKTFEEELGIWQSQPEHAEQELTEATPAEGEPHKAPPPPPYTHSEMPASGLQPHKPPSNQPPRPSSPPPQLRTAESMLRLKAIESMSHVRSVEGLPRMRSLETLNRRSSNVPESPLFPPTPTSLSDAAAATAPPPLPPFPPSPSSLAGSQPAPRLSAPPPPTAPQQPGLPRAAVVLPPPQIPGVGGAPPPTNAGLMPATSGAPTHTPPAFPPFPPFPPPFSAAPTAPGAGAGAVVFPPPPMQPPVPAAATPPQQPPTPPTPPMPPMPPMPPTAPGAATPTPTLAAPPRGQPAAAQQAFAPPPSPPHVPTIAQPKPPPSPALAPATAPATATATATAAAPSAARRPSQPPRNGGPALTAEGGGARADLLAAIRGPTVLKKASERQLPQRQPTLHDTRTGLLDEIRKGRSLKKVEAPPKAPPRQGSQITIGGVAVAAILARRAVMAERSSGESDEDWEE